MVNSKHSIKRGTQVLGAAALLAVMAACGGGGGSASTSSSGVTSSSSGGTPTLGGLNCVAGVGDNTGFTVGVCDGNLSVPPVGQINLQFQSFDVQVGIGNFNAKQYSITTKTPLLPESKNLDANSEFCSSNLLGLEPAFLTQIFDLPGKEATSPRTALLSFTQPYGNPETLGADQKIANPCRTAANGIPKPATYPMSFMDFGTWERYLGETSLYYGGWYAVRAGANAAPSSAKTYVPGKLIGYRLNSGGSYGLSGKVSNAAYAASVLTLEMDGYSYSRSDATGRPISNPNPGFVLPKLSLKSEKIVGNVVTGSVSGSGISGLFEGQFGGPNGEEFSGRFQLTISAGGDKIAGAFAVKSQ